MSDTIAQLFAAKKTFGTLVALADISLQLEKGTILGLIGPSGSGKTTLIKCLLGMIPLDSGQATVFNTRMPNRLYGSKYRSL